MWHGFRNRATSSLCILRLPMLKINHLISPRVISWFIKSKESELVDFTLACGGRGGENNGAKREKLSESARFLETLKSTRIRTSPRKHARVGTKKPTGWRVGFWYWWRRRELNPRPRTLYRQFYILSLIIWFNSLSANRQADKKRVTYRLILCKVTLQSTILVNDSTVCCQTQRWGPLVWSLAGLSG